MKNKRNIWIVSFLSFGLGIILLALAWKLGGTPGFYFDKSGIHSMNEALDDMTVRESKELDAFESMELELDGADLEIVESDRFAIDYCVDGSFGKPAVKVENGKLSFKKAENVRIWFCYFFGGVGAKGTGTPHVTLEVPEGTKFKDIVIDSESADVKLSPLTAERFELTNDYGDIVMEDIRAGKVKISAEDGKLTVGEIAADEIEIEKDYGDVEVQAIEGKKLTAVIEDGRFYLGDLNITDAKLSGDYTDVEISHAAGGTLVVEMESGNLSIEGQSLNMLKARCVYGDVNLGLEREPEEYCFELETEYGEIRMPGGKIEHSDGDEVRYQSGDDAPYRIDVKCEDGDIIIY